MRYEPPRKCFLLTFAHLQNERSICEREEYQLLDKRAQASLQTDDTLTSSIRLPQIHWLMFSPTKTKYDITTMRHDNHEDSHTRLRKD